VVFWLDPESHQPVSLITLSILSHLREMEQNKKEGIQWLPSLDESDCLVPTASAAGNQVTTAGNFKTAGREAGRENPMKCGTELRIENRINDGWNSFKTKKIRVTIKIQLILKRLRVEQR